MGVHTNVQEAEMAGAHSKRGNDEAAEESIGAHLMGDLIHPPPPPGPHWEKVDLLLVTQIPQTWSIEVNIARHLYNLKYLTNVHLCCSVL